ncbi:hypothetical protein KP509_34G052200 [Ceratopteris richardii]|uniref:Glycosyltransferases n=1 Tax=Ceratopteris richardii TaxID=49495 RepID=A0A8T2QJR2_CERRI|nr:hypothetical protein KP509_34G052200 [Ceratopteris richardii]KAH7284382.1 hypothetical protein KP509_34G052200 [Ceratopteris richardii]
MISFRRSLSQSIHDRPLQNGGPPPSSNLSTMAAMPLANANFSAPIPPVVAPDLASANDNCCWPLSWLSFSQRKEMYDRSKLKSVIWKRPYLPVIFCFFLGFVVGLLPFTAPNTSKYKSELGEQEFSLELSNISNRQNVLEMGNPDSVAVNGTDATKNDSKLPADVVSRQLLDPTFGKLLIVVTPTYNRPVQASYLTRLSHTLKLVPPPLLWIVVEMSTQSMETASLLRKTGVMYRHLVCKKNMTDVKDRGVHQRNTALEHIEHHQLDGIVYFADDDNVYTLELFEQMRLIKRFGTWPVAMLAAGKSKTILEGPVCNGHTVIGWHTNEKSKRLRRFHVDMSGFAFNSTILWDPVRWHKPTTEPIRQLDNIKEGFQETTFIEQLVEDESQMEGLPSGCSKIMVWHLHFEAPNIMYPPGWRLQENLNATIPL